MLTPSYDPIIGGTETVVKDLTMRLNRSGVRTDVMTFNMSRKWHPVWKWEVHQSEGHVVYRVPAINPFNVLNLIGDFLRSRVFTIPLFTGRLRKYDILHFHDDADLTFPLLCCFLKKPKILHCHTLSVTFGSYWRRALSKKILNKAADVYIVGSESRGSLLSKLGIEPERIRILPYGVDTHIFVPNEKDRQSDLILFVGRWDRRKGLHILLESLDHLEGPVNVAIIGPAYDDEYSRAISQLLKDKARSHNILCLRDLARSEVVRWFQRASMLVCPSIDDHMPIVCVQALSCGTPVVASAIAGIRDIVSDGEDGILVPPNSPQKIASAIRFLLDNPKERGRLGNKGRLSAERRFSQDRNVKELLVLYEGLVEEARK